MVTPNLGNLESEPLLQPARLFEKVNYQKTVFIFVWRRKYRIYLQEKVYLKKRKKSDQNFENLGMWPAKNICLIGPFTILSCIDLIHSFIGFSNCVVF